MDIQIIHPGTGQRLKEQSGKLLTMDGSESVTQHHGVYSFVPNDNYTSNFGFQWNTFRETQMDSHDQSNYTKNRFFAVTAWTPESLKDKTMLEVGSGAGRFTEVILKHTPVAALYSVDYSNAVEANYKNNGEDKRLKLFQASIYELPFAPAQFDRVFCLGVLQHTPDFKKSVQCLVDMVKPGGELVVDFYPIRGWWTKVNAKYIMRPFTRKMPHDKLLKRIRRHAGWMISLSRFFNRIGIGRWVNRFIPIVDITTLPQNLPPDKFKEWVVLDTFDVYSPEYDNPQRISTVKRWFEEFGMKQVQAGDVAYEHISNNPYVRGIKA